MSENKIGQFIALLRKEKKITQKDLAEQLHITDKAVSKWERGLSCPDITLITPIADILGVTTSELLNGQRNENITQKEERSVDNALAYAEKSAKQRIISFSNISAAVFSILMLSGIAVCSICNIAISGSFTWSLYPISSIIFAWLILFPIIKFGSKGLLRSLITLSVSIIPFLYVISRINGNNLIMPIAVKTSVLSLIYLWCVYCIFKKLKKQKLKATSLSLLLLLPLCIAINLCIAKILSVSFLDIWDLLSFALIIISAVILLIIDYRIKHKKI